MKLSISREQKFILKKVENAFEKKDHFMGFWVFGKSANETGK